MKKYILIIILIKIVVSPVLFIIDSKIFRCINSNKTLPTSALIHLFIIFLAYQSNSTFNFNASFLEAEEILIVDMLDIDSYNNFEFTGKEEDNTKEEVLPKYTGAAPPSKPLQKIEKTENIIAQEPNSKPHAKEENKDSKIIKQDEGQKEIAISNMLKSITKEKPQSPKKIIEHGISGKGNVKDFDKSKPLAITAIDSIRNQFVQCWTLPYGAKDAYKLKVILHLTLDIDGNVTNVDLLDKQKYKKNQFFRAMADSAIRAVHKCSPIVGLPKEQFSEWEQMELHFDPQHMFF